MESIHLNSDKMETHFDIAHINLGQNVFLYLPTHYFHLGEPLSKVKENDDHRTWYVRSFRYR